MTNAAFSIPDEIELLEFFGADPVERSIEDGYWCYEIRDSRNVRLRFSFNIFERSVQTMLHVADSPLSTVAHEGARMMQLSDDSLTCRFSYVGADATLVLRISPSIRVDWSSLRNA